MLFLTLPNIVAPVTSVSMFHSLSKEERYLTSAFMKWF